MRFLYDKIFARGGGEMKIVARRIWPLFALLALAAVVMRFFTESIWLDILFNFSVGITLAFVAIDMLYEEQKNRRWQIVIIGFCVLLFLIEGIVNVISVFKGLLKSRSFLHS